jgi:transposase
MGAARKYPDELRDRAVRLVLDLVKDQDASVTAACRKVGGELGIKADTLRGWAKQAQVDRGLRPGTASADAARIRTLERENAELRRVNAILRTASAFLAAELDHRRVPGRSPAASPPRLRRAPGCPRPRSARPSPAASWT